VDRHLRIVAATLVALAVGAAAWFGARPPGPGEPIAAAPPVAAEEAPLVVHVAGWVAVPGLVEVPAGARVADAVAAAGGAKPGAGLAAMNLAAPVHDGEQVVVPGPAPAGGDGEAAAGGAVTPDGRIRLNAATAAELDALPGVGPVLAERIVEQRESRGPFATVEDLLDVPGIGERKLASLRDLVAVP